MSQQLGPYELEAELGRGGMGVVYRARDTRTGQTVAIKSLLKLSTDLSLLERFRREATLLRGVEHPNLVRVLDLHIEPPQPYAVFEFVEGETLRQRVLREGPLPWDAAVRVLSEVASGAAAAHERNLLHRDIKPDNVLLAPAGAKLADFGLVKDLDQETLTQTGATLGTPSYMAPEQVGSQKDRWGPQTDVYGLAATLYFALTGVPPFGGATSVSILRDVLEAPPPAPSAAVSGLPAWLDAICARGMAKLNTARFPNAVVFRLALLEGGQHAAGRRSRLLGAGVVLALLAALGVAFAAWSGERQFAAKVGPGFDSEPAQSAPLLGEAGDDSLGPDLDPEREAAVAVAELAAGAAEARKVLEGDATLGPLLKQLKGLVAAPDSARAVERCSDICEEALDWVRRAGQGADPMLERELRFLLSDALLEALEQLLQDPVQIEELGAVELLLQLQALVLKGDVQPERVRACVAVLSEGNPDPLLSTWYPVWVEPGQRALPSQDSPDYPRAAIQLASLRALVDPTDSDNVERLLAPLGKLDLEPALRIQAVRTASEASLPHVVVAFLDSVRGGADLPVEERPGVYVLLVNSYASMYLPASLLQKLRSVILPADPGPEPRLHEIKVLTDLGHHAEALERVDAHLAGPLKGWTDAQREELGAHQKRAQIKLSELEAGGKNSELTELLRVIAGQSSAFTTAAESKQFLERIERARVLAREDEKERRSALRRLGNYLVKAVGRLSSDPQQFRAANGQELHEVLREFPLELDLQRSYLQVLSSANPGVFSPQSLKEWAYRGEVVLPSTGSGRHVPALLQVVRIRLRLDPPDSEAAARLLGLCLAGNPTLSDRLAGADLAAEAKLPQLILELLDRPALFGAFGALGSEDHQRAYLLLGNANADLGRSEAWLKRLQTEIAELDPSLERRLAVTKALYRLERLGEALEEVEGILGGVLRPEQREPIEGLRKQLQEKLRAEEPPR